MDRAKIREIAHERLSKWVGNCAERHVTPAILICIGHDHASGQIHVMVPEDVSQGDILRVLESAAYILRAELQQTN